MGLSREKKSLSHLRDKMDKSQKSETQTLNHIIMWNTRFDEYQAIIKITQRNINNLRYADGTTLMAEIEEELKSLLMKVKEESKKAGLNLKIQKLRSWHTVPSLHGK